MKVAGRTGPFSTVLIRWTSVVEMPFKVQVQLWVQSLGTRGRNEASENGGLLRLG